MSQSLKEKVLTTLKYPGIKQIPFEDYENALCDFKIKLPKKVLFQITKFSEKIYPLITKDLKMNESVLNCYDFHYSEQKLKLIEMNTNASGFLLTQLLETDKEVIRSFEESLIESFINSFKEKPKKVFIIDENPSEEKMFVEFKIYEDFFRSFDIKAQTLTTAEFTKLALASDEKLFCYNRDCDFYLDENPNLKKLWLDKKVVLSTHPESYELIASKKNLIDLSNESDIFLKNYIVNEENFDQLWQIRKKLFFKPFESFGSKGVYAGKSVSKKKFQEIVDSDTEYMAQELHLPGKVINEESEWKFDIRAYFSTENIQKVVARVYKGQVTNFKEPGGGFALIEWID